MLPPFGSCSLTYLLQEEPSTESCSHVSYGRQPCVSFSHPPFSSPRGEGPSRHQVAIQEIGTNVQVPTNDNLYST
ncbi:hypothetical protein E2C01_096693 [Portunus trituberculatus]|uniref:Uncharacterized protein n=1 Tax=Portunus trituberculatus TaxID=210409 RepID=A0A5B7K949_PORTR|nr:hypothetical protein [Portunus trituberculatus]